MLGRPVRKGRSIRQLASSCVAALQRQTSVDLSGSETRNQFVASACLSALDLLVHEVCYTGGGRRCPEVFLFMYFLFLERKHTHTHNNERELYRLGVPDRRDQKEFSKPGSG